jgi:hypothetical protein
VGISGCTGGSGGGEAGSNSGRSGGPGGGDRHTAKAVAVWVAKAKAVHEVK